MLAQLLYRIWRQELDRLKTEKELLQNLFPAIAQASSFEAVLDLALQKVCQRLFFPLTYA